MEYKFNGDFTLDDYVQMNRHIMKKRFSKIGWKISYCILGVLFLGLTIFNIVIIGNIDAILEFIKEMIWVPVFIVLYFTFLLSKWRLKKYYISNKIYNELKLFIVNEETISINSESINTILTKQKINKIEFDKDSIYIFTSLLSVIVIKQRFLNNINEFIGLKELIIKNFV
jgi:hypothetical protein